MEFTEAERVQQTQLKKKMDDSVSQGRSLRSQSSDDEENERKEMHDNSSENKEKEKEVTKEIQPLSVVSNIDLLQTKQNSPKDQATKKQPSKNYDEPPKNKNLISEQQAVQKIKPKNNMAEGQEEEDEWKAQAQLYEEGQQNKYFQTYDSDEQNENEITAVYEDEEINSLTNMENNESYMNNGVIQKQVRLTYNHNVQNKHLLILYLLYRKEIYDLFPKKAYNRIDVHPSNKNKIRIFGTTQEEIKQVSMKISEMINKISIIKLNIRSDEAIKMRSSKILSKKLFSQKMIIFKYGTGGEKCYYLGGKGTQPYLSSMFKEIRNLRFKYFRIFDYCNTRSYKIIMNWIIKQKELLKNYSKWNLKDMELVEYIHNFSGNYQFKKQKQKAICVLMTTIGNVDNFSPKQLQNNMTTIIKNTFYAVILIFKQGQKLLPKLNVNGITFKYVSQRKFNRSYVYIFCLKKNFFEKKDEIIKQLEKLQEKNKIYGARYFKHISPQFNEYIKPEKYKVMYFPQKNPYSFSIMPKQEKQDKKQQEIEFRKEENQTLGLNDDTKKREDYKFYNFDWKEHLQSIQSTEISFIQQK